MQGEPTNGHDSATWSPLDSDGWYAARNATTALRDALVRAGLETCQRRPRIEYGTAAGVGARSPTVVVGGRGVCGGVHLRSWTDERRDDRCRWTCLYGGEPR
jgi:hypothetical protein